jgi:transcriptional regulator with XRE-family HTH domain
MHHLEKFRIERGLTQAELASRLGVSQSHVCRVISGAASPGNKLKFRISQLTGAIPAKKADQWLDRVAQAAKRSPAFRALVNSALRMISSR